MPNTDLAPESRVLSFLLRRWFLLLLALAFAIGIPWAESFRGLVQHKAVRDVVIAGVMFLMALPMPFQALRKTLNQPAGPLLAVFVNLGLLPLFAWGVAWLFGRAGMTVSMAHGLLIAATTPCTVASASVWTRRAGGNDAVSLLVTVITNLGCFAVTPLWLRAMTGEFPGGLTLNDMILGLAWTVVVPIVSAQTLRLIPRVSAAATRRKVLLSTASQIGILSMVFCGAVETGLRLAGKSGATFVGELLVAGAGAVLVHCAMLWAGYELARRWQLSRGDRIAVAFAGSQKTLTIGLKTAIELDKSILPMVVYHVAQLLIDAVVADRYAAKDEDEAEPRKPPSAGTLDDRSPGGSRRSAT